MADLNRNSSYHCKFSAALCLMMALTCQQATAQLNITTVQNFNFGSFYQGNSGGTIHISATGQRLATGDIILINNDFNSTQAIFEIEAPAGTIITLLNGPDATLAGSNGGTMLLHAGVADPESPLIINSIPPARSSVSIAAALTVGNRQNSPPGSYQGSFSVIINQQ